ncbi:hypothetical protein ACHAPJ_012555 [Fusarium lateritium]
MANISSLPAVPLSVASVCHFKKDKPRSQQKTFDYDDSYHNQRQLFSVTGTVSEIVIDPDYWSMHHNTFAFKDQDQIEKPDLEHGLLDTSHSALHQYVRSLALDDKTTAQLILRLDQKQRQMADTSEEAGEKHEKINEKFTAAATVLLLSLCENISTLYLGQTLVDEMLMEYILNINYKQIKNPGLQKLQHVRLIAGSVIDETVYGNIEILQYLQLIHRLPVLESVTLEAIEEYQANRYFFVSRSGNMKKLEITHCDISGYLLAVIISIPQALEELKLSLGGLCAMDGGRPLVRPYQIAKALAAHRNSLRVLDIDLDFVVQDTTDELWDASEDNENDNGGIESDYDDYGRDRLASDRAISSNHGIGIGEAKTYGRTIGSLHDFPHLTHLSISVITLLGSYNNYEPPYRLLKPAPFRLVDALPPSLEYLCIYGYIRGQNPDADDHINELLEKKGEKLSKLEVIKGVDEHVPSMRDVFGTDDEPDVDNLYQRETLDLNWKLVPDV